MPTLFDPKPSQMASIEELMSCAAKQAKNVALPILEALNTCCHPARTNELSQDELDEALCQELFYLATQHPTPYYEFCMVAVSTKWKENALLAKESFEANFRETAQKLLKKTLSRENSQDLFEESKNIIEKREQDALNNIVSQNSSILSSLVEQSFRPKEGPIFYTSKATTTSLQNSGWKYVDFRNSTSTKTKR